MNFMKFTGGNETNSNGTTSGRKPMPSAPYGDARRVNKLATDLANCMKLVLQNSGDQNYKKVLKNCNKALEIANELIKIGKMEDAAFTPPNEYYFTVVSVLMMRADAYSELGKYQDGLSDLDKATNLINENVSKTLTGADLLLTIADGKNVILHKTGVAYTEDDLNTVIRAMHADGKQH